MSKIVIAGGTGFLGTYLVKHFTQSMAHEVHILSRSHHTSRGNIHYHRWDGETLGNWTAALEGADILINLNGKSVDCRYTQKNRQLIYSTRINATNILGTALVRCSQPPKLWINASSATIYRHSDDKDMCEHNGEIGSGFSVDVCQKWEEAFFNHSRPGIRMIALRTGIVLSRNDGPLVPLQRLTQLGFGGHQGTGDQYMSWLHVQDFVNIVDFLIQRDQCKGVYNVTAPQPVTNTHVMKTFRKACRMPFGINLSKPLLEIGAALINTETELLLKSRRVIPQRLLDEGYTFTYNSIEEALNDLCNKES